VHIAFFSNYYLPVVNGVTRSIELYREELTRLGHNVFIFAQSDSDYKDQVPFVFRYPSLTLPVYVEVPAVIPVSPFIDQLLPTLKLDVIHTHHPFLLGRTAARKAEELNLPLVFTFHTQYQEYTHYVPLPQEAIQDFLKNTIQNWLRDFMSLCQHIIIPTESMKQILIDEYGLRDLYTVIPTGINLEPFRRANGQAVRLREGWQAEKVLVSVGRLGMEKNWPALIQSFTQVHREHPEARLVIVGDGPEKSALQVQAAQLGVAERVIFTGEVPFSEVPAYLKAADMFIFASITETQGLVTLEALAAGLPVVAVEASGARDILENGEQGYLVPNDPDAMAAAINRLLDSPETMKKFQRSALRRAKSFDLETCAKQVVKVYEQASEAKAAGRYVPIEKETERMELREWQKTFHKN
jgi:glycosyltransferase involved in cell wall biosynthesis